MSFGGTTRRGVNRPFDEICACEHERDGFACMCTRTKEQAKDRCSACMDGRHQMQRLVDTKLFARTEG